MQNREFANDDSSTTKRPPTTPQAGTDRDEVQLHSGITDRSSLEIQRREEREAARHQGHRIDPARAVQLMALLPPETHQRTADRAPLVGAGPQEPEPVGTPYRADDNRISELDYVATRDGLRVSEPTYTYSYGQALTDQVVAPVGCRIMGGKIGVYRADTGSREIYNFADDYSKMSRASELLNERMRTATVHSFDWQMASINEARNELMQMRTDGRAWAGLIVAHTIKQAKTLQKKMAERWPDKTMLLVADADTRKAVDTLNSDNSYTWVISITKISEGVSIDRLRVGVYLTPVTSQSMFEQLRGLYLLL